MTQTTRSALRFIYGIERYPRLGEQNRFSRLMFAEVRKSPKSRKVCRQPKLMFDAVGRDLR